MPPVFHAQHAHEGASRGASRGKPGQYEDVAVTIGKSASRTARAAGAGCSIRRSKYSTFCGLRAGQRPQAENGGTQQRLAAMPSMAGTRHAGHGARQPFRVARLQQRSARSRGWRAPANLFVVRQSQEEAGAREKVKRHLRQARTVQGSSSADSNERSRTARADGAGAKGEDPRGAQ